MSEREAAKEVYFWQYSNTNSFNNMFILLYQKADMGNKRRLFTAFPALCAAIEEWNSAGDNGNDFFRKHGLMK
jgi:hypothetical protein